MDLLRSPFAKQKIKLCQYKDKDQGGETGHTRGKQGNYYCMNTQRVQIWNSQSLCTPDSHTIIMQHHSGAPRIVKMQAHHKINRISTPSLLFWWENMLTCSWETLDWWHRSPVCLCCVSRCHRVVKYGTAGSYLSNTFLLYCKKNSLHLTDNPPPHMPKLAAHIKPSIYRILNGTLVRVNKNI